MAVGMRQVVRKTRKEWQEGIAGESVRTAIGYVRVSTDMQAHEGSRWRRSRRRSRSTARCMS